MRGAAGLGNDLVGGSLMRKAVDIENEILTDKTAERGERPVSLGDGSFSRDRYA